MAGLFRLGATGRGAAVIAALALLAGCADQKPPPAAAPQAAVVLPLPPPPAPPPPAPPAAVAAKPAAAAVRSQKSLVFFDSEVFDLSFADVLKEGDDQIHVDFAGPTSLNSFPSRMNVWLSEVKKSDGTVTVVDPKQPGETRGLFGVGIIFDLIDAINTMQERKEQSARLALTHNYNAKIIYDAASGTAREVLFTRRPVAPPPAAAPAATGPAPVTGPVPTTSGG